MLKGRVKQRQDVLRRNIGLNIVAAGHDVAATGRERVEFADHILADFRRRAVGHRRLVAEIRIERQLFAKAPLE